MILLIVDSHLPEVLLRLSLGAPPKYAQHIHAVISNIIYIHCRDLCLLSICDPPTQAMYRFCCQEWHHRQHRALIRGHRRKLSSIRDICWRWFLRQEGLWQSTRLLLHGALSIPPTSALSYEVYQVLASTQKSYTTLFPVSKRPILLQVMPTKTLESRPQ